MRLIISAVLSCFLMIFSAPNADAELLGSLGNSDEGTVIVHTNISPVIDEIRGWEIDVPFNNADGTYFKGLIRLVSKCDPADTSADTENTTWEIKEGDTVLYSGIVGDFILEDTFIINTNISIDLNSDQFESLQIYFDDTSLDCCITKSFEGEWHLKTSGELTGNSSLLIPPKIILQTDGSIEHAAGTDFVDPVEISGINSGTNHPLQVSRDGEFDSGQEGEYEITYNYSDAAGESADPVVLNVTIVNAEAAQTPAGSDGGDGGGGGGCFISTSYKR